MVEGVEDLARVARQREAQERARTGLICSPGRSCSVPSPLPVCRAGERADDVRGEPGQLTRPVLVSHSLATVLESSLSLTSFFIISSRSSVVSLAETPLSAALAVSFTAVL